MTNLLAERFPVQGMVRRAVRAPIWLYRAHLGGFLGHQMLLLTHRGRKTGLPRQTVLEVLVYDDHSRDRTPQIVAAYARGDRRVRLVAPTELPEGWCGKTFACARLAGEAEGRWLLFLDADARLRRNAAADFDRP